MDIFTTAVHQVAKIWKYHSRLHFKKSPRKTQKVSIIKETRYSARFFSRVCGNSELNSTAETMNPTPEQTFQVFIKSLPPAERARFQALGVDTFANENYESKKPDYSHTLDIARAITPDFRALKGFACELEKGLGLAPSLAEEITTHALGSLIELIVANLPAVIAEREKQAKEELIIEAAQADSKAIWVQSKIFSMGLDRLNKFESQTEAAGMLGTSKQTLNNQKRKSDHRMNHGVNKTEHGRPEKLCKRYSESQLNDHTSRRRFMPKFLTAPHVHDT
jgi:hypothetical protein